MATPIEKHGWTAVPRSLERLLAERQEKREPWPLKVEDLPLPDGSLVGKVMDYARVHLPVKTLNHSLRVFIFEWTYDPETLLLAALLHDIGTTDENQASTRLSFEFNGALLSLNFLASLGVELSQREAVCETIIRRQDLGETGFMITSTAVIHFATVLDNVGLYAEELVHPATIQDVTKRYPRNGWTGCFAGVVRWKCGGKPWANTTTIEGFAKMVEGNRVMEPFD
ncbi:cyanamide hydratase [Hortaea werneckii]|nr:cyanamide hydratase [Hortaea werneckii]